MREKEKVGLREMDTLEPNYTIQNVVASVSYELTESIDLMIIARRYDDVEYNPERFPGLIMRTKNPRATILIFSSGKCVITGLRSADHASKVTEHISKCLETCGIPLTEPELSISNIVASGDLKCMIDLNMAAVVMEHSMYEPEVFPGLIYRMQKPKCVFLIFSTGKVVCAGAKTKEMIDKGFKILYTRVRELDIDIPPENPFFNEEDMVFL